MSNDGEGLLGRPVGELWVELEQDEKQDVCDYLIYCNNSDVMQEFVSQVRHRSYLKARRTGSLLSSKDARSGPVSSSAGETPSGGGKKRKNDGADLSDQEEKKAQLSMFSGLATHTILPVSSSQTAPLPEPAAGGTPTTSATTSSNLNLSVLHPVAKSSQTPSIQSPTATVNASRVANPQSRSDFDTSSTRENSEYPFVHSNAPTMTSNQIGTRQPMASSVAQSAFSGGINIFGLVTNVGVAPGTAVLAFSPLLERELHSTSKNSFQSILFQDPYKKFSAEELRMADYAQGRQYGNRLVGGSGLLGTTSSLSGGLGNNVSQNTGLGNLSFGGGMNQSNSVRPGQVAASMSTTERHPNNASSIQETLTTSSTPSETDLKLQMATRVSASTNTNNGNSESASPVVDGGASSTSGAGQFGSCPENLFRPSVQPVVSTPAEGLPAYGQQRQHRQYLPVSRGRRSRRPRPRGGSGQNGYY